MNVGQYVLVQLEKDSRGINKLFTGMIKEIHVCYIMKTGSRETYSQIRKPEYGNVIASYEEGYTVICDYSMNEIWVNANDCEVFKL